MDTPDRETRIEQRLGALGLLAGPLLALVVYALNPGGHPPEARRLLGIVTLVVVWWMSEAIPLPATALVGSAVAIAAGVAPIREVLAPYANPVIFLFLGSFLLAEAFRKYGLDRRVARYLLGLRAFAGSPRGLLAGLGVVSAALSSALSNTATAALLTPIGLGAVEARGAKSGERPRRFESAVLLAIAYGASIGGIATVIGTPPNLLAAGFLDELAGVEVTFTGWILFAAPISHRDARGGAPGPAADPGPRPRGGGPAHGRLSFPRAPPSAPAKSASGGRARAGRWSRFSWRSPSGPRPRWLGVSWAPPTPSPRPCAATSPRPGWRSCARRCCSPPR